MAEAFTAGVRPGGLTDDTQIRMLLCYLVKVAGPVKRETMQGALLQEQLVNYFEFADALAEVEKQQLVTVDEDGRYTITRRGTTVADTLAYRFYPDSCNSADLSSSDVRPGIQDRIPDTVDHFPDRTRRLSDLCRIYSRQDLQTAFLYPSV